MNNYSLMVVPKDFCIDEAADFKEKVSNLIENNNVDFIFDFSKCTFIDSTGLGALVSIYKKCIEKNGSLKLRYINLEINKLFKLTKLDEVFDIEQ
ncbi:STAS domain-containing protein [uncultured Clostridium sp.]|uniref:STAS domain-containing protein n=1 Tax=uncultured Clostridium sp. TaxID=59620 RepID=UPI0025F2E17E|nr:STAS domain-containing protein [uncultured Clostridium sp.]